ncbi:TetR/AcrR family transcriptional regulator [Brevibacillus daliensis]|uniref:TetR/AcrR family transcriptional regulator n=1 Tax=Brevibacillus daliensis TaxID=2892995 RepID=UPI001E444CBA|nr:TetR/AcrR family transcriptional regulator [Brevibacillus daliensis]
MSENQPTQTLTKKGLETRAKLLHAAEHIFGQYGYYEASIVLITQHAQVAQGTFYNYFESKKAIYDEVVRQLNRGLRAQIKEEIASATSHEDTLRIGFLAFFRWVKNHPNLYSIVQQAVLVDQELYRWYYDKLAMGYQKSLTVGIDEGAFRKLDQETIAYCLLSIGQFLGMRWVYWEGQDVPEDVFETAMSMVFGGLQVK